MNSPLIEVRTESSLSLRDHDGAVECSGALLDNRLFGIEDVRIAPDVPAELASQIGIRVAAFCRDHECEILMALHERSAPLHAILVANGFTQTKRKLVVRRNIAGYSSPYDVPFTYWSLAETGVDAFARVMLAAAEGDPFSTTRPGEEVNDLSALIALAGATYSPHAWRVALIGGEPVGCVLPQEYEDTPGLGTQFYIGIIPAFRGRGLGKALHAAGLQFLAESGVAKYVGSTDERNAAMLRVFDANGCAESGRQGFFALTSSVAQRAPTRDRS